MKIYDIVIIGGGPAGLAAAVSAKKNGIDSILILENRYTYISVSIMGSDSIPSKRS